MKSEDTNNKKRSRRRFLKEGVALAGLAAGVAQPGSSQTRGGATSPWLGPLRCIVTGQNAEGKSTVISDGPTRMVSSTRQTFWITDDLPVDNKRDVTKGVTKADSGPPPNGSAFHLTDFQPGMGLPGEAPRDNPYASAQFPSMHHTKTLDYMLILDGEMDLRTQDGKITHVKAGDIVITRGVVHGWIVRTKKPCRMCSIQIAATEMIPKDA